MHIKPNYEYSKDSNLQHFIYIIEGYRTQILLSRGFNVDSKPYSSGSARDISFQIGMDIAKHDLTANENADYHVVFEDEK